MKDFVPKIEGLMRRGTKWAFFMKDFIPDFD